MIQLPRQMWLSTPMMRGEDVLEIQRRLAALGAELGADGIYGIATRNAVAKFQEVNGLQADGIVGNATWTKLFGSQPGPALADTQVDSLVDAKALVQLHGRYSDGCQWEVTKAGVQVSGVNPAPVDGAQSAVARVWQVFAQPLASTLGAGSPYPVPVELVIACICTESSGNPSARRFEPGCDRENPERTPAKVSFGLMQTLLSTAREALKNPRLSLDELQMPETSIRAGAAYIWRQGRLTGFDPPLVAAAYNAGGLYYNGAPANHWRLRQYPIGTAKHVDRFIGFFNAAIGLNFPQELPSLARML